METLAVILLSIGLLTMLAYCLYVGINYSISVTFYDSPQRQDWIFITTMMIFAFCSMIGSSLLGYYWFTGASVGIVMVAIGANYTKREGRMTPAKHAYPGHMIGAYGVVLGSTAGVAFDLKYPIIAAASLLIIIALHFSKVPNKTYWIEWYAIAVYTLLIIYSAL